MSGSEQWGVLVNECGVFATTRGSEWWALFWCHYSAFGRITSLGESIAGGWQFVTYDDREDADLGREHMIERGIHPNHVKVLSMEAARKNVHRGHVKYGSPNTDCSHCAAVTAEPEQEVAAA